MPCPRAGPLRLSARSIGSRIRPLLDRVAIGRILATFARSCYLELGGRIVALVAPELLDGPLNIVVSLPSDVTFMELPVGAAVTVQEGVLYIAGRWHLDIARSRPWDARIASVQVDRELRRWVSAVAVMLEREAPPESFAGPERPPRAADAMLALAGALSRADPAAVGDAARALAGLGPGLTPSGDDVLAGTLLAIALVRPAGAEALRDVFMVAVRGRTTRISEAYLEAAAVGEAGEAWHGLVAAMTDDGAELERTVRRVLAFGETSGADMLAGFVLGLEALLPV